MILGAHSTLPVGFQILFIALIVIVAIIAGLNQGRVGRVRSRDLEALAARLQFDRFDRFDPEPNEGFAVGWGFLGCLDQGTGRYAFNIMQGKYHENPLFVFDYHYQTGEGKNRQDHYLTILMLVCKEAFPKLTIGPEHLLDKIAESVGLENNIKFESADFSRTFKVRSTDKKFAYDVCNPQMIEFLLANRDLRVEIQGPVILLAFEPQLPVERIEFNLQRLAQIRSLLPEYLFTNV